MLFRWDKDTHDSANKDQEAFTEKLRPDYKQKPSEEREPLELQAKEYLEGQRKWQTMKEDEVAEDEWEDIGEAEEVETDVVVPKS